jgi:hypothetical protein
LDPIEKALYPREDMRYYEDGANNRTAHADVVISSKTIFLYTFSRINHSDKQKYLCCP